MNAIEVLKEALDLEVSLNRNHGFKSGNNTELEDAYKKAILALEQKEKRERLESDALCSVTNEDLDDKNREEQELKKQGALEQKEKLKKLFSKEKDFFIEEQEKIGSLNVKKNNNKMWYYSGRIDEIYRILKELEEKEVKK